MHAPERCDTSGAYEWRDPCAFFFRPRRSPVRTPHSHRAHKLCNYNSARNCSRTAGKEKLFRVMWQPLLGVSLNNSASAALAWREGGEEKQRADSAAPHLQVSVSWCCLMLALRSLRTGPGSMVGRPVAEVVVVHVEEILLSRPGCRLRLRRCRYRTGPVPVKAETFSFQFEAVSLCGIGPKTIEDQTEVQSYISSLSRCLLYPSFHGCFCATRCTRCPCEASLLAVQQLGTAAQSTPAVLCRTT